MKKILSLLVVLLCSLGATIQAQSVPPLGTNIETWYLKYTMHYFDQSGLEQTETDSEPMKVCIDGTDVYFNLANPLNGNAWVKGTLDGSVVTFPKGQKMGTYAGSAFYLCGLDETSVCDVKFYYDSAKGVFTLGDMYLLVNGSATVSDPWCYFSLYTVSKEEEKKPELVTPPNGLLTSEFVFTGSSVTNDDDGFHTEQFQRNVRIGTLGVDVYIQGLCDYLPLAWIKGKRDNDGDVTFASGQYLGKNFYDLYFAAARYPTSSPEWRSDITLYYDSSTKSYTTSDLILINTKAGELSPVEMYANAKFTRISNVAATPKAPSVTRFIPYGDYQDGSYGLVMLDVPAVSTTNEAILTSKLSYKLFFDSETPYVFMPARYTNLTQEMTLIPYSFGDGKDIYMAGSAVFFYDDVKDAKQIGVQSVYTGGDETHESDITWFDVEAYLNGIKPTSKNEASVISEQFTDLQGRKLSGNAKGLVLKTVRMSDGTQKTIKTIRK